MHTLTPRMKSYVAAAATLAMPALAMAAGGAGGEHHEASPLDFSFIASVINFAIFVFLLRKFAWPKIKEMFAARAVSIREQVDQLARERVVREEQLSKLESRLADFDKEKNEYIEGVKTAAQAEVDRILADAERQAKQIVSDANRRAETLKNEAQAEVLANFVDEVVDAVEEKIAGGISADRDRQLINDVIGQTKVQ